MKLTVIGYNHAYPMPGEATSCYLIQDENTNIVIDLGSGSLSILQKYINIEDIDAVIISHYHADHYSDTFALGYGAVIKKAQGDMEGIIPIYGPQDDEHFERIQKKGYVEGIPIDEDSIIEINGIKIEFMQTKHGVYALGMKISKGNQTIVYTADTAFDDRMINFSKDCSLLVTECSLYDHSSGAEGHMAIEDVKILVEESNPKSVVITHLPNYGDKNLILEGVKGTSDKNIMLATTGLVCSVV